MRYLWDEYRSYYRTAGFFSKSLMILIFPLLRLWDVVCSNRVDYFISNSTCVQSRIKKRYGRDSSVIFPPIDLEKIRSFNKDNDKRIRFKSKNYYITFGALEPYKRVDLAIEACLHSSRNLLVIGKGSQFNVLKQKYKYEDNIQILEDVTDQEAMAAMSNAKALIFPGLEDFGLVPLEAQACGIPVIAFKKGGALDTVTEETGVFFDDQNVDSLIKALNFLEQNSSKFANNDVYEKNLKKFTKENFKKEFTSFLSKIL